MLTLHPREEEEGEGDEVEVEEGDSVGTGEQEALLPREGVAEEDWDAAATHVTRLRRLLLESAI